MPIVHHDSTSPKGEAAGGIDAVAELTPNWLPLYEDRKCGSNPWKGCGNIC